MGSTNGITRGQLRPHFSGRSPPFVLAALCVGLGILGVSYWSLSQQYNDLEEQFRKTLAKKDSIEDESTVCRKQLTAREEEYISAKKKIEENNNQILSDNNQIKTKTDQINDLNSRVEALTKDNTKCKEELSQKSDDLGDAVSKLKDIEQQKLQSKDQNQELSHLKEENKRLENRLQQLKQELFALKNTTKSDSNIKPLESEKPQKNQNDFNELKTNNISIKSGEQSIKDEIKLSEDSKLKVDETVVESVKSNQILPSNGLAEEDRKAEALVEANEPNNEMLDDFKDDNLRMKSQI